MGDWGKLAISAYEHTRMTPRRVAALETELAAWLDTKPGAFTDKEACAPYERARALFMAWSDRRVTKDDFEVGLARLGFRAGVVVFGGEPKWLLVLPSSVDTAIERLAETENRPSRETT